MFTGCRERRKGPERRRDEAVAVLMEKNFPVEAGAYESAGEASTTIKRTLKQLGFKA